MRTLLIIPGLLTILACTGCDGAWAWRERSYPLPEQALDAQRRDLDQEVAGVATMLDEDRLPGRAVALLASRSTLTRLASTGDSAQALYVSGLAANEAAAGARAADRAGLFAKGCAVTSVDHPEDAPVPADAAWVLMYLPRISDGVLQWWLLDCASGRIIGVPDVPAAGADRHDRFVEGLLAAARKERAGDGSPWPAGHLVQHQSNGSAWMPDDGNEVDGNQVAKAAGLTFYLTGDRGASNDAQAQMGAVIALLAKGGNAGPRVDLPPTAPATARARVLVAHGDATLVAEIQTAPERMVVTYVEGPREALLRPTARDGSALGDEQLAPLVARALSSLRLSQ